MKRLIACLAILLLCITAQAKRAPNLELKTLAGEKIKLSDLRGSIVVLNFWATWCGPCQEELPLLSRLTQEYAGKKVKFVAISADDAKDHAKVDKFVTQHSLAMDIWTGGDLDMLEHVGLGNVLPGTMIIDEQGEVVARVMGQAHEEDVKAPLDWLLNGKTTAAPPAVTKRY